MTRRILPLAFVLAALPACGGTDDGRPNGDPVGESQPLDPCKADDGYEFQNVVDFDPMPGEMPEATRFQNCDSTSRCTINFNFNEELSPPGPHAGATCPMVQTVSDPGAMQSYLQGANAGNRCGEPEYATHIFARNLATCTSDTTGRQGWGGSLSFSFSDANGAAQTFDASEWDGFSFWIKKASSATRSAFIAATVDPYTAGTRNIEPPSGGMARSCDASGATVDENGQTIPDTDKCDGFGVAVTLTDDWTFVPVRFESMRQKGFGMPSPLGQVLSAELVRLQFLISAGDWDFWIDDVAFFREPEE